MEEHKVLISLERYDELTLAETLLEMIKSYLFESDSVRLNYNNSALTFEINSAIIKTVFSGDYYAKFQSLLKEKENV